MKFTDDDLKRLKNHEGYWRDSYDMRKANPQISESWGWVDGLKIEALLHRLECAEKVIENPHAPSMYEDDCSGCEALKAWRSSKGER